MGTLTKDGSGRHAQASDEINKGGQNETR
jgi:hypothetical protein